MAATLSAKSLKISSNRMGFVTSEPDEEVEKLIDYYRDNEYLWNQLSRIHGRAVEGLKPEVFKHTSSRPKCGRNQERVDNFENHFLEGSLEGGMQSEQNRD